MIAILLILPLFLVLLLDLGLLPLKQVAIHFHVIEVEAKIKMFVSKLPLAKVKTLAKISRSSVKHYLLEIHRGFVLLNSQPLGMSLSLPQIDNR